MVELSWIGWIIIGGIAGWIASKIMKTDAQQGIILNVVVGVVGGLLGGFLASAIFGRDGGGWIYSFIVCLIGACILLFIVKAVTGRRSRV
ncbi:GlsB/YeaQ/YmgE family stress response membrane protein [Rhodococcoides corynebacterioides]|uniref:GlsB/YeaQ/YmgE family stress response membrane protein n=1 Tax=Rhodococcoides corynebacterioides TaxID=53972 RepID=UPI001C9A71AE|nr:GlsB/YeaQ/YmgE family stress response membrane protein [Rhodococcus corynebacterioides]MBY6362701.1 GlsB/YeaQ/YmgE family stress response membrane protein [Rhodococcus corynebacterioides]